MKPTLRKAIPEVESSFVVRRDIGPNMKNNWHYHAECELLCIKKSFGTWLIGDYKGSFESGDIILLGSGTPHSYRHEEKYIKGEVCQQGEALVTLFSPEIFGDAFINLPESKEIKSLLELSKRGLKMTGNTKKNVGVLMEEIQQAEKGRKLINLLTILQLITEQNEYEILATEGYACPMEKINNDRISLIIQYTYYNYHKQITIEKIASMVNMSTHSFCRFFKEKTKKTYMQFLMEVRIGQACKLLIDDDMHSAEVGYTCGYNSISHFNHQFKTIKNKSPLEYKKSYMNLLND
ncbi:MAG: AraC family transcriptional regulator [Chitinophagaceae bacterium]